MAFKQQGSHGGVFGCVHVLLHPSCIRGNRLDVSFQSALLINMEPEVNWGWVGVCLFGVLYLHACDPTCTVFHSSIRLICLCFTRQSIRDRSVHHPHECPFSDSRLTTTLALWQAAFWNVYNLRDRLGDSDLRVLFLDWGLNYNTSRHVALLLRLCSIGTKRENMNAKMSNIVIGSICSKGRTLFFSKHPEIWRWSDDH